MKEQRLRYYIYRNPLNGCWKRDLETNLGPYNGPEVATIDEILAGIAGKGLPVHTFDADIYAAAVAAGLDAVLLD